MDKNKVYSRDKWTCFVCQHKYDNLSIVKWGNGDSEDDYITLCNSCSESWNSIKDSTIPKIEKHLKKLKIVLIGDIHGNFSRLDEILTKEYPFDYFISVGDVGTTEDATPSNISICSKWISKSLYIEGNHDTVKFFKQLESVQDVGGLTVAGLNGIIKSKTFARDTKDINFREVLYLSHIKDIDILVTHQTPTMMFNGMGEPILDDLLSYTVPTLYIMGHIHKYRLRFYLKTFCLSLPIIDRGYAVSYWIGKSLSNFEVVINKGKREIRV
jgi:predicted phosphodiesterase